MSVERGEFVTVLNRDDPDWFWVLRHCDGNEGFVPSGFVYPGHVLHSYATTGTTTTTTTTSASGDQHNLSTYHSILLLILTSKIVFIIYIIHVEFNSANIVCSTYHFHLNKISQNKIHFKNHLTIHRHNEWDCNIERATTTKRHKGLPGGGNRYRVSCTVRL